jgi:DNA-binding transcriptional MerR regulator
VHLADLGRESGIPIPTIKFYLREGLLPPGRSVSPNRAEYDVRHLRRLRLVRALTSVGDLPLGTVREVLDAIDDPLRSLHDALGVAHHALARGRATSPPAEATAEERAEVDGWLDRLGWRVTADAPDRNELATVLATLRGLGWGVDVGVFDRYARAADRLAAWELKRTPRGGTREETAEAAVIGTVVFQSALVALRRLAQEHHSAVRFDR